ncbi:hypothetical protein [Glycomyces tritici]|uniref:Uncharacterized protein n=1 Tax=Glycomyces tritici TaxID=2665176 RepID=A0ABT7YKV4_9ACTN|nr:hypothetical protein [Glycomyces tritici]MDN3239222.1 hypothetical protein [Glycomyces tritici]
MEFWIVLIVVPLLLSEFTELAPWLAKKLIRGSALLLRDEIATERFAEEWAAELETKPGKLVKLGYALFRLLLLPLTFIEVRIDAKEHRAATVASPATFVKISGAGLVKELEKAGMTTGLIDIKFHPELGYTAFQGENGSVVAVTEVPWSDDLPSKAELIPDGASGGWAMRPCWEMLTDEQRQSLRELARENDAESA